MVKEGRVRLYKTGERGREITLAMLDRGKMFGEMALTAQGLRQTYAQGVKQSLLISLNREALQELILDHPRVGMRLIERLSERVRALENRLEDISLKDVPPRVAGLILQRVESEGVKTDEGYKIPTRYSRERLATMIGANRVSITRAFRGLREMGAVELRRRLIHVKDIEALGSAAGEKRRARQIADSS